MQPAPVFGKRSAARPRPAVRRSARPTAGTATTASSSQAAFFAAARAEQADEDQARTVPRSVRAAMLAGLVVGCALAGLDAMQASASLRAMSGGLLTAEAAPRMVPLVIALGLYGGARTAAIVLLVAHAALRRMSLTSHAAYALGGGAVALAVSATAIALANAGVPFVAGLSLHGPVIDAAAGIGAGFLYRVLAGAKAA